MIKHFSRSHRIVMMFCAVVISVTATVPASALTQLERTCWEGNCPAYSNEAKVCGSSSTPGISGPGLAVLDGHKLPTYKGRSGNEQAVGPDGHLLNPRSSGRVTFAGHADIPGEEGKLARDYYITMRWPYAKWAWNGSAQFVDNEYRNWLAAKPRKVLVTNPRTSKSIIAVVMEAGPAPWTGAAPSSSGGDPAAQGYATPQQYTPSENPAENPDGRSSYKGRVSGFPPVAYTYLGYAQGTWRGAGDVLTYAWAPDQNAKPGPVNIGSAPATGTPPSVAADPNPCAPGGGGVGGSAVYYSQGDSRWNKIQIPSCGQTIGYCGCGPTAGAMVVATLADKTMTPPKMVDFFEANNGMGAGTLHSIWPVMAKNWNLKYQQIVGFTAGSGANGTIGTDGAAKVKAALQAGQLVVATGKSANSGLFTEDGHIVLLTGLDANGNVKVNDPKVGQSEPKATATYTLAYLAQHARGAWGFSK